MREHFEAQLDEYNDQLDFEADLAENSFELKEEQKKAYNAILNGQNYICEFDDEITLTLSQVYSEEFLSELIFSVIDGDNSVGLIESYIWSAIEVFLDTPLTELKESLDRDIYEKYNKLYLV